MLLTASFISCSSVAEPIRLVSSPAQTGISGAGSSFNPGFSANGRFLTFISHANNLVTHDNLEPYLDVFVRDLVTGKLTLVSVNTTGNGGGNGNSSFSTISSNGQFVAFESTASNLVPNDTNGVSDIFIRDLVSETTTLASSALPGSSSTPLISSDGHWVVFESPFNNSQAIYAYDRLSNTMQLVSGSNALAATSPTISSDARIIAYISSSIFVSTNIDILVRDVAAGVTVWASTNVAGFLPVATNVYQCSHPVLSGNGRFIAFQVTTTNSAASQLFRHDLQTQATTLITTNMPRNAWPQLSDDGRFLAHENAMNVYLWDSQTGSNTVVNLNLAGTAPGNAPAHSPSLTSSDDTVVFVSGANDLAANTANVTTNNYQVFVRDMVAGVTRLASVNRDGVGSIGNLELGQPTVTADGSWVAFESVAGDVVANDFNGVSDIFLRDLTAETTTLVSARHASRPATSLGQYFSLLPNSVSTNGRYLVFSQLNDPSAARETGGRPDVMLFDVEAGLARAISFDTNDYTSNTNLYLSPIISGDGSKLVAIRSLPTGSVPIRHPDVFAWSVGGADANNTPTIVNRAYDFSLPEQGASMPAVSGDGRLVMYQSRDANLISGGIDGNGANDIYIAAPWLNTNGFYNNRLISGTPDGLAAGNSDSIKPQFSPDGRWAVFQSKAGNLVTNGNGSPYANYQLIAADLGTNSAATNYLINPPKRLVSQDAVPQDATNAVFSADSRYLFYARAQGQGVYRHDLLLNTNLFIADYARNPSPSADGRWVAYESSNALPQQISQVIVQDVQTGQTNLVSVNRLGTGGGNAGSTTPLLSGDARFVVFTSKAGDLVDNDTNKLADVFVRDRLLGVTLLVSGSPQTGAAGNSISSRPVLGADGRTVVFQSFASDLAPGDYNDRRDVFVLHLGGKDSDGDGMDDDWEMAGFGNLSRDGTGDFDGDGVSDKLEFLAGTDPTNGGSVLRVLKITRLVGGGTTLIWSAVPGRNYRVEFKAGLADAGWTDLPGPVTLNGSTGSAFDATASGQAQRYYRVSLITP